MRAVGSVAAVLALLVAACGGGSTGLLEVSTSESATTTSTSTTVMVEPSATTTKLAVPLGSVVPFLDAGVFTDELAGKDYPVVVHFWKPGCVECLGEAKVMADAARQYEGRVEFIGIDTDDDQPSAKAFVAEAEMPYDSLFDFYGFVHHLGIEPTEVSDHHHGISVPKVPVSLLFGPGGRLVEVKHGAWDADALEGAIEDLLRLKPGEGVARLPEFDLLAFQEEMAGSDLPTVVSIWNDCGRPDEAAQAFGEVVEEYEGRVNFVGIHPGDNMLSAQTSLLDHEVPFIHYLDTKYSVAKAMSGILANDLFEYQGEAVAGPLYLFAPGGELAGTHEQVVDPDILREVIDQLLNSVG